MAYRIDCGAWGDFTEWREVELSAPEMSETFGTEREAEQVARRLDARAWRLWELNHPGADEEWTTAHAPAFHVIEEEM